MVKILMGKKKEALASISAADYIDSSDPAALYALLNRPEEAIYWLEKAYQERSVMMVTLKNFWVWDNLREEARFQAIYDQMGFPESIKNRASLESIQTSQGTATNSPLLDKNEIEAYLEKLERLMNKEEIFTDPSLSLRKLAGQIDLHANKLSWLLNEHIGKNFNEYINAFRLEKFKEQAIHPQNNHLTLLGLAYESGFNSKTVFNAFFKKMEQMTPRAWVKKHLQ
jgi:AraC-like DNA-binding protein